MKKFEFESAFKINPPLSSFLDLNIRNEFVRLIFFLSKQSRVPVSFSIIIFFRSSFNRLFVCSFVCLFVYSRIFELLLLFYSLLKINNFPTFIFLLTLFSILIMTLKIIIDHEVTYLDYFANILAI